MSSFARPLPRSVFWRSTTTVFSKHGGCSSVEQSLAISCILLDLNITHHIDKADWRVYKSLHLSPTANAFRRKTFRHLSDYDRCMHRGSITFTDSLRSANQRVVNQHCNHCYVNLTSSVYRFPCSTVTFLIALWQSTVVNIQASHSILPHIINAKHCTAITFQSVGSLTVNKSWKRSVVLKQGYQTSGFVRFVRLEQNYSNGINWVYDGCQEGDFFRKPLRNRGQNIVQCGGFWQNRSVASGIRISSLVHRVGLLYSWHTDVNNGQRHSAWQVTYILPRR